MPELADRHLEEVARLAALDVQCGRGPRKVDLTPVEALLVHDRVAEILARPPEPPFGLASPGVSPAGYIDDALRKRLEKVAAAAREADQLADEARAARDKLITEAVRKGVSLSTVGRVVRLSKATVQIIANRGD